MNKIMNVTKFHLHYSCRTTYFIAPFILLMVFLYNIYYMCPVDVISNFCLTAMAAFVLMCWLGYSFMNHSNDVLTQILFLRVNNEKVYYLGQLLFYFLISVITSVISVGFPLIQNAMHGFGLYKRPLTPTDVIGSFLLIVACGFIGGCVGSLFGPETIRDRKLSLCIVIMITALTVGKSGIIKAVAASKYLMWILPPVSDVTTYFSMRDQYTWIGILIGTLILYLYGIMIFLINTQIQKRKGFN